MTLSSSLLKSIMKELELLCSLRTHAERVQGLIDLLDRHPIEIDRDKDTKCNI
jgi:hypothetical protein